MAMWEENMADTRPLSCLRAAQCAMELQEKLGGSNTGDLGRSSSDTRASLEVSSGGSSSGGAGSELNIKISLGYGNVTAFHVGGERNRWEFFLSGTRQLSSCLAAAPTSTQLTRKSLTPRQLSFRSRWRSTRPDQAT